MGELMPGIPNLPGDETSWQAFTDQFETLKKGDKPISLTNWDDTDTVPAVAAGSALEIAGATYRFPSESAISDESGLASGVVYVVVKTNDPDANSATAYFTNTAPEWRDDLNGWYDTTGANRYTGHLMDWDGATAYIKKRVYPIDGNNDFTVEVGGSLVSGGSGLFSGDIICNSIETDNVAIILKEFTGTWPDTTSPDIDIVHGISDALNKIEQLFITTTTGAGQWQNLYTPVGSWTDTNIRCTNAPDSFANQPYRIIALYKR